MPEVMCKTEKGYNVAIRFNIDLDEYYDSESNSFNMPYRIPLKPQLFMKWKTTVECVKNVAYQMIMAAQNTGQIKMKEGKLVNEKLDETFRGHEETQDMTLYLRREATSKFFNLKMNSIQPNTADVYYDWFNPNMAIQFRSIFGPSETEELEDEVFVA